MSAIRFFIAVKNPLLVLRTQKKPQSRFSPSNSPCSISHAFTVAFHHLVFVIRVALTTTLWRGRCGFQPPDILSGGWGRCSVMWLPGPVGEAAWVLGRGKEKQEKGAGLSSATRRLGCGVDLVKRGGPIGSSDWLYTLVCQTPPTHAWPLLPPSLPRSVPFTQIAGKHDL